MNELQARMLPLRQKAAIHQGERPTASHDGLVDWLSAEGRYAVLLQGRSYELLAENETRLAEAQTVLRVAHGGQVAFGPTFVHTWVDPRTGALMEPHVALRLDVPALLADFFAADLRLRGAASVEVDPKQHRTIIRAEARLAAVRGYERAVLVLTDGAAHALVWLARYAPVDEGEEQPRRCREFADASRLALRLGGLSVQNSAAA